MNIQSNQRYAVLNKVGSEVFLLTSIETEDRNGKPLYEQALRKAFKTRDAWLAYPRYQSLCVGIIEPQGGGFKFVREV